MEREALMMCWLESVSPVALRSSLSVKHDSHMAQLRASWKMCAELSLTHAGSRQLLFHERLLAAFRKCVKEARMPAVSFLQGFSELVYSICDLRLF